MNFIRKNFVNTIAVIFILAIFSTGAYFFGYQKGVENPKSVIIKGVNNIENNEENVDFSLFWDAWLHLKEKFVDADKISNQDLVYGAISGLFNATEDPYSVFMNPLDAKKFNEEVSGEFGGIGAELGIRDNFLVIVAPLKNTPAEKIGLKAGDKILKIKDEITAGMPIDEAVKKIRGERGTEIKLTIFRNGWEESKEFKIVRDIIQIPTLDWKMVDKEGKEDANGRIIYAQLYNFYERAPMLFYQMVLQSSLKIPEGIILDLRNNPGGYLEAAVNIAGWFLDRNEIIVSQQFNSGEIQSSKNILVGILKNTPVVILINEGSASASEILAGALRDNRDIKLVGAKSFGKGSIQEVDKLKDGSFVKITIAKWLTPKGHIIEKNGLEPDFEVKGNGNGKSDPQFEKALEILKQQLK